MLITFLVVIAGAAAMTLLASAIVYRRSNHSALWNMAFGILLAFVAIVVLTIIAAIVSWFAARAVFGPR